MNDMQTVREKGKKILQWQPSAPLVAILATGLLVILLVPLLWLALYATPWYDDYNYGRFAKGFFEAEPNIIGAVKGALYCMKTQWYAWQGTFSSIFFMSLMPAMWGGDTYFLGPVCLIFLLVSAVFVLTKVLVRDVLQADKWSCLTMQAALSALLVERMYTAQEGIYWYNAGIHYVGMHSFLLMLIGICVSLLKAKKKLVAGLLVVAGMFCALLVSGANYVTALQSGVILFTFLVVGFFFSGKKILLLLPSMMVFGVGFYYNVTAPGNHVRSEALGNIGKSPVYAVVSSFGEALRHVGEFTDWFTVALIILLVPVIWSMVGQSSFSFRYPLLVLLWSVCLYATGFTPSLYTMGHGGVARTLNAVKITYQLLLVLNVAYLLGWLQKKLPEKGKKIIALTSKAGYYAGMCLVLFAIFAVEPNKAGTYSSYGAFHYLCTGEAYRYHSEYLERVERLCGEEEDVVLQPLQNTPWLLCRGDLSENAEAGQNRAIASWYEKNSVVVKVSDDSQ